MSSDNDQYYNTNKTQKSQDAVWDTPNASMTSTDIDVASTSSFDTVPYGKLI